jgi:hypothetical protein
MYPFSQSPNFTEFPIPYITSPTTSFTSPSHEPKLIHYSKIQPHFPMPFCGYRYSISILTQLKRMPVIAF